MPWLKTIKSRRRSDSRDMRRFRRMKLLAWNGQSNPPAEAIRRTVHDEGMQETLADERYPREARHPRRIDRPVRADAAITQGMRVASKRRIGNAVRNGAGGRCRAGNDKTPGDRPAGFCFKTGTAEISGWIKRSSARFGFLGRD